MPIVIKTGSRPPWVGLAAAVWVLFAAGNNYNFALFTPALKSVLGFNQQQITFLGVANDIGASVGILAAIACNKFPPWKVLLFGAFSCFVGYGVLWLSLTQTLQNLPYCVLWFALLIGSNSCAWFQTAVIVTNMRNFPLSRGTVSGILKGYVGLSAAIYTVIYNVVLNKSNSSFLLFLAIGLPIICFCVMYFIRPCTPASGEQSSEHIHFLFTQGASILLAIYLLVVTITNDKFSVTKPVSYTLFAIMVIFLLAPLAIPLKMTLFPARKRRGANSPEKPALVEEKSDLTESLLPSPGINILDNKLASDKISDGPGPDSWIRKSNPHISLDDDNSDQVQDLPGYNYSSSTLLLGSYVESEDGSRVNILLAVGMGAKRPHRGENFKFHEALIKADFWLLWLVYFLGVGSGVTVLNNLAQIGYAQGENDTTVLLALFAFFNFVGRLGGGVISEHFVRSKKLPRTIWMTITQAIMMVTFLLYTSSLKPSLYLATILLGICYGVQSVVMTPTASELFGLKHVGEIYNFIQLGNPIGALLFSVLLAGKVYDQAAKKQGVSTCLGPTCFGMTFLFLTGVCGLGVILGLILTHRIRPVYERLYATGFSDHQ